MPDLTSRIYFVSDVHLGLKAGDPQERETRFVGFLRSLPADSDTSLVLLGDIWDFWYEYRDVVPRQAARVIHELMRLMDNGVQIYFCPGNHDLWTFSYLQDLGIKVVSQPYCFTAPASNSERVQTYPYALASNKASHPDADASLSQTQPAAPDNAATLRFCVGHGDGIGGARPGYAILKAIFTCRFLQRCFGALHPWFAFRFGQGWSGVNRKSHRLYCFIPEKEPAYKFALDNSDRSDVFIFGHFHDAVDTQLPDGKRFIILKDWIGGGTPHVLYQDGRLTVSV